MRLAKVIGTVVATVKHSSIAKSKMLMIQPLDDEGSHIGDAIVAIDTASAGIGESVYFVLSREAAFALPNSFAPVDAVITGIVDQIDKNGGDEIGNREKIFVGKK